jgi:hypothetical protein
MLDELLMKGEITPEEYVNVSTGGLSKGISQENEKQAKKEIAASALKTGATIIGLGKAPSSVIGRLGVGTATGATFGAARGLEEGSIGRETIKGAAIGFGVSGLLEGIGALLRGASNSSAIKSKVGKIYTKELQPPTKNIAKDIEKGFKTFGERVASVTDDAGNPVYKGNYKTLLKKSKQQLSLKDNQLNELLSKYPDSYPRKSISGDIISQMEDIYGRLTNSQKKQIQFEISRMPSKMTLNEVRDIKKMYDGLIPESFWSKIDDPAQSFSSNVKYNLRNNARKFINEATQNPQVQLINNEMSVAMDVRKLSALQQAIRQRQKTPSSISALVGRVLDDYIFNPAITTRAGQAMTRLGQKTGQTVLRQATRLWITKGIIND